MYIFQGTHLSVGFGAKTFSIQEWCFVDRKSRPCKTRLLMWLNLVLLKTKTKPTSASYWFLHISEKSAEMSTTLHWKLLQVKNLSFYHHLTLIPEFSSIHSNSIFFLSMDLKSQVTFRNSNAIRKICFHVIMIF